MTQMREDNDTIQPEPQTYRVAVPGHGDVIIVVAGQPTLICHSCHRTLVDTGEIATSDPIVCSRCFSA